MNNKYLAQSNQFTGSIFPYKKEIHKDCIYLLQSKIDFHGEVKDEVHITLEDYCKFKGVQKNDTYSKEEFFNVFVELAEISGAFHNTLNNTIVKFNLVQDAEIDRLDSNLIKVKLTDWSKRFFFKKEMANYITNIVSHKKLPNIGYTRIEDNVTDLKGLKRKIFYETLSQFKHTGYCKISVYELKQRLGYIKLIDTNTKEEVAKDLQLKMLFIPEDGYKFVDEIPSFSIFERDFLKPAIKAINVSTQVDINNLKLKNKIKSGRKITYLEFTFNALGKELTKEEIETKKVFMDLGLDEGQVHDMLKRIGYKEMYGRYMHHVIKRVPEESNKALYFDRESGEEIKNMGGYCYSILFPELKKVNH